MWPATSRTNRTVPIGPVPRSLDIWRVRDGMAVEHWDELNTLEVFTELGLVPPMRLPGGEGPR